MTRSGSYHDTLRYLLASCRTYLFARLRRFWKEDELARFTILHDALKDQREFDASFTPPPPSLPENDYPLFPE